MCELPTGRNDKLAYVPHNYQLSARIDTEMYSVHV